MIEPTRSRRAPLSAFLFGCLFLLLGVAPGCAPKAEKHPTWDPIASTCPHCSLLEAKPARASPCANCTLRPTPSTENLEDLFH
ncbi:hypothetical protein [Desulfuromonas sp.]|uniref:hypothetical protein n=1 Tax=Desulfuromonas sp. TaxID=892 RepID=UPI0025C0B0F0|nr:hypothetical protein [Desulfuromonas sp.]